MTAPYSEVVAKTAGASLAPRSWLDYEHKEYTAKKDQWQFIKDFYTGEVLLDSKIDTYLVRKRQGEPSTSFSERKSIADYTNHFGMIVDGLAGVLFMTEPNTTRRWNNPERNKKGLGDEKDPNSPAARLVKDADGLGHGWLTIWKDLALELTAYHKAWVLVDLQGGVPVCRVINVMDVPNWVPGKNGPTAVLLKEEVDTRGGIQDKTTCEEQFLLFEMNGWSRWRRDSEGRAVQLSGPGDSGSYRYKDLKNQPCLPIFPVDITMKRMVGWSLAKKANAIFNLDSSIDWILWAANFPKLNVMGGEETFGAVSASLEKGDNVLQNEKGETGHHYIAPQTQNATIADQVAKRKTEALFIAGFREYGDSARDRVTATEVRQDVAAGAGAYLTLLKAALEGAEQRAAFLMEQAEFKDRPFLELGGFFVQRSEDFMPFDIHSVIERAQKRYFGTKPIPAGRDAKLEIVKQILQWEGLVIKDDQILAAIDNDMVTEILDRVDDLAVPAEVKTELVLRVLEALGLFNGTTGLNRETAKRQILDLATAKEDQSLREGEALRTGRPTRTATMPGGSEHARDPIPSADGRLTE